MKSVVSLCILFSIQSSVCLPAKNSVEYAIQEEDGNMDTLAVEDEQEDSISQKRETSKLSAEDKLSYLGETQLSKLPGEINPCNLAPEKGNCKENITSYYYDDLQKNCLPFKFTGCGSNENNFRSLSECEDICIKKRDTRKASKVNKYKALRELDLSSSKSGNSEKNYGKRKFPLVFCSLERDNGVICPGIKRGNYLNQFYFDDEKNRCLPFIYNGCGGNSNRFMTMWECTLSCEKKNTTPKKP